MMKLKHINPWSARDKNSWIFANSADPDEAAHQDLHCLLSSLWILYMIDDEKFFDILQTFVVSLVSFCPLKVGSFSLNVS